MSRLPIPGSDDNVWGDVLNDFLQQSHNNDGTLKAGVVGDAQVSAIAQGKVTGLSASLDAKVGKGDQVINAVDYGAVGNNSTDNTAALQAAINAAGSSGKPLFIPGGTYRHGSLTLPTRITIRGANRGKTFLSFTGTGTAFTNATPGVRIYDLNISDLLLVTSTGAIGFDLDSVSTSTFMNMTVTGFSDCGFYLRSSVSGGCVYNRFYNVTSQTNATGFKLRGISSNANIWHGCRAGNCSAAGWDLQDSNDNAVMASQAELCGTGFYISGSLLGACDSTRIRDCRIENCTTGINIASANVRYTDIGGLWSDGSTPTVIADSGTTTRRAGSVMSVTSTAVRLDAGLSLVSGAGYALGTTSSSVQAATGAPLYLRGTVTDTAAAVGTWIGNTTTLTNANARIVGFSKDTAVAHAQPAAYIDVDGSYEFASGVKIKSGAGSPEGVVTAVVGSMYLRSDGGANSTLYVKESGTGNTGWIAK